jgi:flagellar biosynthesis GTPase FlhF
MTSRAASLLTPPPGAPPEPDGCGHAAGDPAAGGPVGTVGAAEGQRFRGRTMAEVIPQIQSELGPDAIVVARRTGLEGGIGGFFQRPFVELEARPGGPGVDIRDGEEALPLPLEDPSSPPSPDAGIAAARAGAAQQGETDEEIAAPRAPEPSEAAGAPHVNGSFAGELIAADAAFESGAELVEQGAPAAPSRHTRGQAAIAAELARAGFDEAFAGELIAAAERYTLALCPRMGLRRAVRKTLAQMIPQVPPPPAAGAAILVAGPGGAGKTSLAQALAETLGTEGAPPVSCATIARGGSDGELLATMAPKLSAPAAARGKRTLSVLAAARKRGGTLLLDTPAVSPARRPAIRALAGFADELRPERVVVALPATLGAGAACQLLAALEPLRPHSIAITHADETDQLGVAVQAACSFGLAPELALSGDADARTLVRLDPVTLAERLLP